MSLIKNPLVFVSTLLGIIFGCVILHPFVHVINALFHHHEEYLQLHLDEILLLESFTNSFNLIYWPHFISYGVLSGILGYFWGRSIQAYRTVNKQVERFSEIGMKVSGIMHDVNNPLTGILWAAQILESKIDKPQQIEALDIISKAATRISKMIMEIKINARSADTIELSRRSTDLKSLLEQVISEMNLSTKIRIDSSFEGQVSIDNDIFERVLWNLIKNADEALAKTIEGRIEISITESVDFVTICIGDNGPGIAKNKLRTVFKLGQTFGKPRGSGIGLYNCKEIVEAHGGKIWIVSKIDKGTNVYVRIPK